MTRQKQQGLRKAKAKNTASGQNRTRPPNSRPRAPLGGNGSVNRLEAAPAAQGRVRVNPPRAVQGMSPNGNRVVVFEEYVQDIISSPTTVTFNAERFPVQPGLSTLFAWLADQAINYQEYRFRRLSFRFESSQTTGIAGKVMYAFSPDAADPVPVNKQEMLEYGVKGKCDVWQEFEMSVPVSEALGAKRYIRSGSLAANLDIKTYDIGALFVASSGIVATNANLGELYVKYEVELMTPVVQSLAAAQARSAKVVAGGTITESLPFGDDPTITGGLDVTVATGNYLQFNRVGNYLIEMEVTGVALQTVYAPTGKVAATSGGAQNDAWGTVTQVPGISNAAADAGTEARVSFIVAINQRGAKFHPALDTEGTSISATTTRVAVYAEV